MGILRRAKAERSKQAGEVQAEPDRHRPEEPVTDGGGHTSAGAEAQTASSDVPASPPMSHRGWPSAHPIVIGDPSPSFEPAAVSAAYRITPYRPDTIIDGWSTDHFTLRAASMRGHLHRYNGAPRQDDYAVAVASPPDRLIVAVADGISAAPNSHIGASTAVRYASQWLASMAPTDAAEIDWQVLIKSAAWSLIEQAAALVSGEADAAQAEADLATTLTCAVCEPADNGRLSVRVVAVGDSGAWVLHNNTFRPILGGKSASESGVTSSAVTGLPRVPDTVEAVEVILEPDQVLLIGTDGFGDPLGGGGGQVGALFSTIMGSRIPSLIEFAHALDFSRETFDDDRTLVAVWPRRLGQG